MYEKRFYGAEREGRFRRRCGPLAFLIIFMLFFGLCGNTGTGSARSEPKASVVVKVLDGDTVVLKEGFTVRYLGVDAPEMDHERGRHDCYALEAYERNRAMVLGRSVKLDYDGPSRDEHGRVLAYVTTADGLFVNAQLIREGLAYVFRGPEGFSKFDAFVALQRQAVRERRGLHGQCPVREETFYVGNGRSFIFHRPACAYGAQMRSRGRLEFATRWEAIERGFRPCRRCQP